MFLLAASSSLGCLSEHLDHGSAPASDAGPPVTARDAETGTALVCSPVAQTGCGSGQKCVVGLVGPECVADGKVLMGAVCGTTGADECIHGTTCVGETATATHICRQFCSTDKDCQQPAVAAGTTPEPKNVGHCIIALGASGFSVCSFACNPVPAAGTSGCAGNLACSYGSTVHIPELTSCELGGEGGEGTSCLQNQDCVAGLTCVSVGAGAGHCRPPCRAGTNTDCGAGDVCVAPGGSTTAMFGFCCPSSGC